MTMARLNGASPARTTSGSSAGLPGLTSCLQTPWRPVTASSPGTCCVPGHRRSRASRAAASSCGPGAATTTAAAGIPVSNTPDYGTMEVADHALAMALVLGRGLLRYHTELLADPRGAFNSARSMGQRRLSGQTFAVLGIGRIGTAAALRAK